MGKFKRMFCGLLGAVVAAAAVAIVPTVPVQADEIEPGVYSVTVVPTYQNPDTGLIDDVGQNPAIGNTMVQAQVQSVGYVEIYEDGTIYLNTRWNQADANIYAGFETSSDGSQTWTSRSFEVTSQIEAGTYEFAGNTFEATVTDYRIQLDTLNDTIRCTNYVEAMARECIWFCYISEIYDFDESSWTNVQAPSISADTMNSVADTYAAQQEESGEDESDEGTSSGGTASAGGSTSTKTSTKKSTTETSSSSEDKKVDGLKDRTVASAKTADELLEESEGIADAQTDSGDAAKAAVEALNGSDTETVSADTGKLIVAVIIGAAAGAAIVGIAAYMMAKKRKNYKDLFADVDDESDAPAKKESSEKNHAE